MRAGRMYWAFERVEACLGVMLAGVLVGVGALAVIAFSCQITYEWHKYRSHDQQIFVLAGLCFATVIAGLMLNNLTKALDSRADHPIYHMARAFARRAILLRLPLGIAALATAVGVMLLGHFWVKLFEWPHLSWKGRVVQYGLTFIVLLGAAYASNALITCFLAAIHVPRVLLRLYYRSRYLIDAAIAFLMTGWIEQLLRMRF